MLPWDTGVPEDSEEEYAWFSIAAAQGTEDAEELKNYFTDRLTSATTRYRECWDRFVIPFR